MSFYSIRGYQVEDGSAILPVNTTALGDVTVVVYHARSTFGGKVQGKVKTSSLYQQKFDIVITMSIFPSVWKYFSELNRMRK